MAYDFSELYFSCVYNILANKQKQQCLLTRIISLFTHLVIYALNAKYSAVNIKQFIRSFGVFNPLSSKTANQCILSAGFTTL